MANIEKYCAPGVYDPPGYSQAVKVTGAQTILFLAGQVAYAKDGSPSHRGDFKGQARAVFAAIKAHAGLVPRDRDPHGRQAAREALALVPDGGSPGLLATNASSIPSAQIRRAVMARRMARRPRACSSSVTASLARMRTARSAWSPSTSTWTE